MMKKENKKILTLKFWIILGILLVFWASMFYFTFRLISQPELTITEEVCWDGIKCNHLLFPINDSDNFGCNGTIIKKTEDKCDGNVCVVGVSYCLGIQKICQYEECHKEQICEQKEVDENTKICVDKYGDEGDATWCVLSQYVNIGWLDENCLCKEFCLKGKCFDEFNNFIGKKVNTKEKFCSKYSCSDGRYEVEVRQ